jgi:hypothetical protein
MPCWGIATGLEHPISHCLPQSFPVRRDDHSFDAPLFFGGNAACRRLGVDTKLQRPPHLSLHREQTGSKNRNQAFASLGALLPL